MRISMDRQGNIVQAGEGTFRVPMGVMETDNSLSNPVAAAEMILERERVEYATMAAAEDRANYQDAARQARNAFMDRMAMEHEDYIDEAMASETGGEHPLTYIAALQSMSGNSSEQWDPLSGYLLSQDGVPAFDRTMNGYPSMRGMGNFLDDLSDTVDSVTDTVDSVASSAGNVLDLIPSADASTPQAVAARAAAKVSATATSFMKSKIMGVPAPLVALVVVGGVGYLVMKKKK